MHVQGRGLAIELLVLQHLPERKPTMNAARIKDALMTTAVVLGVIWALNQTPAKPFVQKALGAGA